MADVNLNIGGDASKLLNNLREIRTGFNDLGEESKQFSSGVNKGFDNATKSSKKFNTETKKTAKSLDNVEKELNQVAAAGKKATNPKRVKAFNKELKKTKGSAGGLGSSFKALGGTILAAFGTRAIINFAKGSIDAFRQQEAAVAKVRQGIKSTNAEARGLSLEDLKNEASDLQKNTLFGDEEILNGATAQLLTFTNIGGDEFKRTQKVALDLATVLDGDLQSASIQLGKALNDPVQNLSALSRSGIQFTAQQKDQIKVLTESGKLQEAQGVILGELERQYGGQAEAAALADGGLTQLGNAFGDVQEMIGAVLVDALQPMILGLKEFFESLSQDDIDNFLSTLATVGKVVLGVLGVMLLYAAANKAVAIQTNLVLIAEKARAFFTRISSAAMKVATAAQWVWNAAMSANPVGIFILALAALATGIAIMATAMALSSSEMEKNALKAKLVEDATVNLSKAFTEEATEVDKAFNKLQDKSTSTEEYAQILSDLESQYNINLDQYKDENGLLIDLEGAQRAVNTAVLEGIVAKQKAEAQNKLYAASVANEVSVANIAAGITDEGADDALGFWEKAGLALVDSFESIPDKLSAAGAVISGDLEEAGKIAQESAAKLEAKFEAARLANLKQAGDDIKAELEVIDEVYDEAGKAVEKNLGDLALGFADGLVTTSDEVDKEAAKLTAKQKKEAEKRRKIRLKEQNALFKLEEDFIKAVEKLEEQADKARIDELEGGERIEAEKELALAQIDILEDGLKRKLALIELEATTTAEQLSKLSNEEKEARIQGIQDNIELEESQRAVLGALKQSAIKKSNDELIKFIFEEEARIAEAEAAGVEAELAGIDLAAESATTQVGVDALDFDSELAAEQFKEEQLLLIRQTALDAKAELIAKEEQLKIEALERERVSLEGQTGAEVELRKEALDAQIENANTARDNAVANIQLEQAQISKQLDAIAERKSKFSLAEALGLTQEEFDQVKEVLSEIGGAIFDEISKATDEQLAANEKFVDLIEGRIDEQGDALDREIELNKLGFASNIAGEQAKLDALQAQREAALKEQEKLRKRQAILEQAQQVGSLLVAIAGIIAQEGVSKGVIGLAIAAAAIPVLFGIFAAAKKQAGASAGFAEGGYTGDGHMYGVAGDVHYGEFVHTKEKTNKHRKLFEAIHTDNLPMMQGEMMDLLKGTGVSMSPDIAVNFERKQQELSAQEKQNDANMLNDKLAVHLAKIDNNLESFLEEFKNQETTEVRDGVTVKKKGNQTRYIRHTK